MRLVGRPGTGNPGVACPTVGSDGNAAGVADMEGRAGIPADRASSGGTGGDEGAEEEPPFCEDEAAAVADVGLDGFDVEVVSLAAAADAAATAAAAAPATVGDTDGCFKAEVAALPLPFPPADCCGGGVGASSSPSESGHRAEPSGAVNV